MHKSLLQHARDADVRTWGLGAGEGPRDRRGRDSGGAGLLVAGSERGLRSPRPVLVPPRGLGLRRPPRAERPVPSASRARLPLSIPTPSRRPRPHTGPPQPPRLRGSSGPRRRSHLLIIQTSSRSRACAWPRSGAAGPAPLRPPGERRRDGSGLRVLGARLRSRLPSPRAGPGQLGPRVCDWRTRAPPSPPTCSAEPDSGAPADARRRAARRHRPPPAAALFPTAAAGSAEEPRSRRLPTAQLAAGRAAAGRSSYFPHRAIRTEAPRRDANSPLFPQ